jgi:hypothetical protein
MDKTVKIDCRPTSMELSGIGSHFWHYTPVFDPAELDHNTFRHLKWLGCQKLGKEATKFVKNGQNW